MDNIETLIAAELEESQRLSADLISISIISNDITNWQVLLRGPINTPYQGGLFFLNLQFPTNYPNLPPKINFINKIYHPNINLNGNVALSCLKIGWNNRLKVKQILCEIQNLLTTPNMDNVLVPKIAQEYRDHYDLYFQNAKQWTQMFALQNTL